MPPWASSDWLVAVIAAVVLLGVCLAVALPYGALLAVAAGGKAGDIVSGLVTGAFLPFVMFGVETVAARSSGDSQAIVAARYLPLLFLAVPIAATWVAMRFAVPRARQEAANLLALVVKIALIFCVIAAVMASLLSIGDASDVGADGFFAEVSVGSAAFYPFLVIVPAGLAFLWRRGIRPGAEPLRRLTSNLWARSAAWGAVAFVLFAAIMSVLALVADIVTANDGRARLSQIARFPMDGLNEGVAGAVVAMGGAVARLGSHTSLLHWGSYDLPGDTNAPAPLFLLLLLAPAVVALVTYRRLEREGTTDEHRVLTIATAVALGFVVTAWLLSFLGRIQRDGVDPVVEPSPRGAFGLGLLWAALGAALAVLYWSRQRRVRWNVLKPRADASPAAGVPAASAPSSVPVPFDVAATAPEPAPVPFGGARAPEPAPVSFDVAATAPEPAPEPSPGSAVLADRPLVDGPPAWDLPPADVAPPPDLAPVPDSTLVNVRQPAAPPPPLDATVPMDAGTGAGSAAGRRSCPQCRAPAAVGTSFCAECGARLRPLRTRRVPPPA